MNPMATTAMTTTVSSLTQQTLTYDNTNNNVVITVKYTPSRHWEEDTYVCIHPHGSYARSAKSELRIQNPAFAIWTDREMMLTMTLTGELTVDSFELHDE